MLRGLRIDRAFGRKGRWVKEILCSQAVALGELFWRAAEADFAAIGTSLWADFDDLIGLFKQEWFVFDQDDSVAASDLASHGFGDSLGIARV